MSYVFVKTTFDYADEFDVDCCYVDTEDNFNNDMEKIKIKFEDGVITGNTEFYFGTNEALYFNSFEDFAGGVEITNCSKEFYDEFCQITSSQSIGHNMIERLVEHEGEE